MAITTPASVACGIRPTTGARNSSVASATPAVTRAATCVRAPAFRFTAVCEVPPPPGIAPKRPPSRFAAPVATSSWFGSGRGSPGAANARPAAIVSVKLMSAIATAAGQSASSSDSSGRTNGGRPLGMCPTTADARRLQAEVVRRRDARRRPPAAARAAAGQGARGRSRPRASRSPTASVGIEVSGRCRTSEPSVADPADLVVVDAQQLRRLVEHDHEPDARLEAGEHRLRDEVGDEAEPQQAREQQDRARQQREGRGRRDERRGLGAAAPRPRARPRTGSRASWSC